MTEYLLTSADVAERCQISPKTVLRAIHRGRLRASRLGESGAYRIRNIDVEAWLEESVVTPPRQVAIRPPVGRVAMALDRGTDGRLQLTADMGRH